MRREITYLAILGLTACAPDTALEPPYDVVARVLAADIAAPPDGGALTALDDIVRITAAVEVGALADDDATDVAALAPVITFEARGRARLELDPQHVYGLDTTSGAVRIEVVLE